MEPIKDRVVSRSIQLFESIDDIIMGNKIPEEWIEMFKSMLMSIIVDISIHFQQVPKIDNEGFELWKSTMWMHEYCNACITEIVKWDSWDVNWFKHEYDFDITNIYIDIYKTFLELC